MSSKTRTRKTRTTATAATATRALRPVPDQPTTATARTEAEDKLWAALHANPNRTTADLSTAAKIGKSTAQKILVKWAGDGSVTRTAGVAEGGRRAADLWAIAEVTDAALDDTASEQIDPDPADNGDATNCASGGGKTDRLAPGALRGMVEDWLRDHPETQFGATAIAKDLGGKSSGAVSNALEKLVADGVAVKTQDKPRRFALAPAQKAAASATPAH